MDYQRLEMLICDQTSPIDLFVSPFVVGDRTFFAGPHMMVAVYGIASSYREVSLSVNVKRILELIAAADNANHYAKIPEYIEPETLECPACRGAGHSTLCPACDGEGEMDYDNCGSCGGAGHLPGGDSGCPVCNGFKLSPYRFTPAILPGRFGINYRYLLIIKSLPGIEIDLSGDPNKLIPFRYSGGVGVVMPMRLGAL